VLTCACINCGIAYVDAIDAQRSHWITLAGHRTIRAEQTRHISFAQSAFSPCDQPTVLPRTRVEPLLYFVHTDRARPVAISKPRYNHDDRA
jgi:hypothetical protein